MQHYDLIQRNALNSNFLSGMSILLHLISHKESIVTVCSLFSSSTWNHTEVHLGNSLFLASCWFFKVECFLFFFLLFFTVASSSWTVNTLSCINLSIFPCLSKSDSWWQQVTLCTVHLPSHAPRPDEKIVLNIIILPAWSAAGCPPSLTHLEYLHSEVSRRHPNQRPKSP